MTCEKCEHFRQHYRKEDRRGNYSWVYCGHCTKRKGGCRKPDAPACERFQERPEAPKKKRGKLPRAKVSKERNRFRLAI